MDKYCPLCEKNLLVEMFNRDIHKKDGLDAWCRKCRKTQKSKHYAKTKNLPHFRWKVAQDSAKRRGYELSITEEEYGKLISLNCHYCDHSLREEVGSGMDRIHNDVGYTLTNVVPCCATCNLGRGDRFSYEEWGVMIKALMHFRFNRF